MTSTFISLSTQPHSGQARSPSGMSCSITMVLNLSQSMLTLPPRLWGFPFLLGSASSMEGSGCSSSKAASISLNSEIWPWATFSDLEP